MKAIWCGEDDIFALRYGKCYEVKGIFWDNTMFSVEDETGEAFLYPAEDFDIVNEDADEVNEK